MITAAIATSSALEMVFAYTHASWVHVMGYIC